MGKTVYVNPKYQTQDNRNTNKTSKTYPKPDNQIKTKPVSSGQDQKKAMKFEPYSMRSTPEHVLFCDDSKKEKLKITLGERYIGVNNVILKTTDISAFEWDWTCVSIFMINRDIPHTFFTGDINESERLAKILTNLL